MLETACKCFEVSVLDVRGHCLLWCELVLGQSLLRMWMNCANAYLAGTAVIQEYTWSGLGDILPTDSHIDLQVLPSMGHCASRWIIPDGCRDHISLFLLLQGVDSHMLLQQPLIYCHFAHGGQDPCYLPVKDWEVLKKVLMEALDNYNELNAAMHLVLFEDAMQHVWVDESWCLFTKWKWLGLHNHCSSVDHSKYSELAVPISCLPCSVMVRLSKLGPNLSNVLGQ